MPYDRNANPFGDERTSLNSIALEAFVITPDDVNDLARYARVQADAAGTLRVLPANNADDAFVNRTVAAGEILPFLVRRVYATGTTVTVLGLI